MAKERHFVEVDYVCKCGHKQTVRYFPNDSILPATCCVNCRAGFNSDMAYGAMAASGRGMVAQKKVEVAG